MKDILELLTLCEAHGYGWVMHEAERLWGKKIRSNPALYGPAGGEHTCGPCAVFMVPCGCRESTDESYPCDWCCGAGRVTERVREAQRAEKT